jgi:nucleotide-binding universal stress UspA family protein
MSASSRASSRRQHPQLRCLLVGYDRSDASRDAVAWAARAVGSRGRLVVVHACGPTTAPPLASAADRRRFGAALMDELLLDGDAALLDADLDLELSDADPVDALTGAAEHHRADAIVVGRERHSRLRDAVHSVTGELLRRSDRPVIAVPAAAAPPGAVE